LAHTSSTHYASYAHSVPQINSAGSVAFLFVIPQLICLSFRSAAEESAFVLAVILAHLSVVILAQPESQYWPLPLPVRLFVIP
jgi:hypothetical protein